MIPMKDDRLISLNAAIDGLYEMASDVDHLCTVRDYVDFLESLSAQPKQFNPCTVCQEFDCTGCKFRRTNE